MARLRRAAACKNDSRFKIAKITEIGYQGITINVGKSELAKKHPLGKDPRVREAFELALDRDGIVQVVMEGEATVRQPVGRAGQPVLREERAGPEARRREGEGAAAGGRHAQPDGDADDADHVGRAEDRAGRAGDGQGSGFDVKIQSTEFATSLNLADKGEFDAYVLAWSGRADPDGNIYSFDACKQPLNYAGYCKPEVDELLNKSRTRSDLGERAQGLRADRRDRAQGPADRVPVSPALAVGVHDKLSGLRTIPDGLVRVQGLKLN